MTIIARRASGQVAGSSQLSAGAPARRRGRPPSTSPRQLEQAALDLFAERGFEATTVGDIAAAAGVSGRTFFRYFDSKVGAVWGAFDREVIALREALLDAPDDRPLGAAIRDALVSVNRYRAADIPELRRRMQLIGAEPALRSSAAVHYDAWEREVSEFVARRTGQRADDLYPLVVGRATLAARRAAFDVWVRQRSRDLTVFLDEALTAVAVGAPSRSVRRDAEGGLERGEVG